MSWRPFFQRERTNVSHIFDRYFRKHGHYPRVVVSSGVCEITVEFAPGYISITQHSPYQGTVWITRSAWFALLRKAIPLTKKWEQHEDFDVPEAMREAYQKEMLYLQARRVEKKTRTKDKTAQQHARFLRAQERARRRADATD
jgi:hypothetical protein